jgi:flagellar protein FliS
MATNIYARYLENEVLSADPVKLVVILYRAALEATGAARRAVTAGDIRERSNQITRAWEVLHELRRSLDGVRGGEIARSLGELYDYMQNCLNQANAQQAEAPLAEVEGLLTTLLEAWREVRAEEAPAPVHAAYSPGTEYVPVSCAG